MLFWPPQLALLIAALFFLGRLSRFDGPAEALLAAVLAVATVWTAVFLIERLRAAGVPGLKRALRSFATESDA